MKKLSYAHFKKGNYKDCIRNGIECLTFFESFYGGYNEINAEINFLLGKSYLKIENEYESLKYFEESLAIYKVSSPNHKNIQIIDKYIYSLKYGTEFIDEESNFIKKKKKIIR